MKARAIKSQEAAGRNVLSCDVTHGRGLREVLNSKQASAHLLERKTALQKKSDTPHDKENTLKCHSAIFSLHLFTPHLSPRGTTQQHAQYCTDIYSIQHAHTDIVQQRAHLTPFSSCLFWIQTLRCEDHYVAN